MRKRQLRVINSSCVYDIHSVVFIGCCDSARSVESVERSDGYMFETLFTVEGEGNVGGLGRADRMLGATGPAGSRLHR